MTIDFFVPGITPSPSGWPGGFLAPWPSGLAAAFIEAYTHPDAVVLDPFAVSDVSIREAVAAGRRIIATNSSPLSIAWLRDCLSPPEPAALTAAVTRLGDSPKRGVPLREHLDQLYRTRCPACRRPAVAGYFIWSREPADPRRKWVTCPACGEAGLAAADAGDLAVLDEVETRGLHYWYLLDRVASPQDTDGRARAEALLEIYTPRALYAIADLLMKIEATFDEEMQVHLKTTLLTCLDAASSLHGLGGEGPGHGDAPSDPGRSSAPGEVTAPALAHPAGLRPPPRFVERNVWRLFEAAARQRAVAASATPALPLQADLHWATRLPASSQGLVWVHNLGVGAVGRSLSPESVPLVLTAPPQPDPAAWGLAYLWTGWLFGAEEAARLKSLALQKWPDWAWYQAAMASALRALRPVFRFDGRCVLAFRTSSPHHAFAVALAALAAGYDIESWQHRAIVEHQFTLTPAPLHAPPPSDPEALRPRVVAESAKAAADFVAERGEPVQTETLHIAAWHRLMRKGVLETAHASLPPSRVLSWLHAAINEGLETAQAADLAPVSGDDDRPVGWWLGKTGRRLPEPLSDRVEKAVLAALRETPDLEEGAFRQSIYRRFNGPLTPDAGLVRVCLEAYGEEVSPGHWRLRPDEREAEWQERMSACIRSLLALGERLGYHARQWGHHFDVVWEEEARPWATFNLAPTADVARFLPGLSGEGAAARPEVRWRNLVMPAARTGLWQHKLAAYPWLARTMQAGGWTFIKIEHLSALAARANLTRHDLKAISGLVPLVERGEGQLPLF
jgi:hypothetical protein